MKALICIFLPSAVNSQLQKVIILVLGLALPYAHNPARNAPLIPESSPYSHRPVQIGLFRFFLLFAQSSRFHMSELHLDKMVRVYLSRWREGVVGDEEID